SATLYDVYLDKALLVRNQNKEQFRYQPEGPGTFELHWVLRRGGQTWHKVQRVEVKAQPDVKFALEDKGSGRYLFKSSGEADTKWFFDGELKDRNKVFDLQLYDQKPMD